MTGDSNMEILVPTNTQTSTQTTNQTSALAPSKPVTTQVTNQATVVATKPANQMETKMDSTIPANLIKAPDVSSYVDFRQLLLDFYNFRREQTKKDLRPYSYAMFSAAADIKSPNYLKMIIDGKRNLSPDMIGKFAKAMGLNKDQSEEFRLLVLMGQESEPGLRNSYLKELSEFRFQGQIRSGEIDAKTLEKLPNWIGWILYAMLDQEGVEFTPEKLREALRGKASTDEIEDALRSLIKSGQVVQDAATGAIKKADLQTETPDEIPTAVVRKLQSQLMYLGLESLFQDSAAEREFGTLTMSLTQAEFEDLRFQLRKIRKQVHKDTALKRTTTKGERVYQLNLQLFPVTVKNK
jgi:uncharacterized protein (TIGR02147 family)